MKRGTFLNRTSAMARVGALDLGYTAIRFSRKFNVR